MIDDLRDTLGRLRALMPLEAVVAVTLLLLGLSVTVGWLRAPTDPLGVIQLLALVAVLAGLVALRESDRRADARRSQAEAGLTKMLQGLSRSASSDAIVSAIIADLLRVASADHAVVVRRMNEGGAVPEGPSADGATGGRVIATLFVTSPQVRPATIELPQDVFDGAGPEAVADQVARRMRSSYGLGNPLAAPLIVGERLVGVLVLSRRSGEWSAGDRRLLKWAAQEMSAALARAFAFEAAETQARVDPLTGLPNRRHLEELVASVGPGRRRGDSVGALMIDIDHFKLLNDRYGHAVGDDVLRAVADRIAAAIRASDTPARFGGEEFAVVLPRATREQAIEVGERIRRAIETIEPASVGVGHRVTVSIGVAVAGGRDIDVARLLMSADAALYQAKRKGRNRVAVA